MKIKILLLSSMLINAALIAVIVIGYKAVSSVTIFSNMYSEDNFRSIKCGNSSDEIIALLGQPLAKYKVKPNGELTEFSNLSDHTLLPENFSQRPNSTVSNEETSYYVYAIQADETRNYEYRAVTFDVEGRLIQVKSYLYVE